MFRVLTFKRSGKATFSKIHPKYIRKNKKKSPKKSKSSKFWKEYLDPFFYSNSYC